MRFNDKPANQTDLDIDDVEAVWSKPMLFQKTTAFILQIKKDKKEILALFM
jgi:hypothetical protein